MIYFPVFIHLNTGFYLITYQIQLMKRFFKKLHKWLSIPVGILISFICLSGAILVFQEEILEMYYPERYFVNEVKTETIPLDRLVPMVNKQLIDNSVSAVKIPSDSKRTYTMTLSEGFRISAFVNPYTGEITGYHKTRESAFFTVMSFHRWFMDSTRTVGKYAVGISTLIMAFILISGFILWFPREFKKSRFKIQSKKGRLRLMFDLHNVLGAYACLILLICSLSGLMWSFEWYRNGVFSLLGAETEERGGGGHGRGGDKKEKPEINTAQWQNVATAIIKNNPDNNYIRVEDGKAFIRQKYMANTRAMDEYAFDKQTGEINKTILYADQPKQSKIWGWAYSLHVGNYWGIWSKIFTFVAALIGASLPITGYYLTLKKRKNKKRKAKLPAIE